MFNGVFTALITPFGEKGQIDFPAMEKIIEANIASGIVGFVLLGTTAETPTLSKQEKHDIVAFAKKVINGRVKIIIGAGSNSTEDTFENAKEFLPYNPDAFLIVTPYYNKPNPSGLAAHYAEVAKLEKPIILYHIPGRTGLKVPVKLMKELVEKIPMIKGVKESDYDISHITCEAVELSTKIDIICGNDDLFLQMLSLNAKGIISAACNALSPVFVKMFKDPKDFKTFADAYELISACYYETNPTCVKYILNKLGFCSAVVRLPLGPISDENKKKIDSLVKNADKSFFIN
ncbi:Dihydrodipicolinate synthase [Elusimicrobium minutum Pei191]|uniref:4-hydroxy-tetrahydrodipicolinate synthase n=1 Tax=Elusimicrobium minutum (strain Pei191) TaxID=445932 RepID=B2KAQ5_ELUMP|nr:4-hydroxy-tetrahydrodipicolinate synthase [Elusimicrobium minutum]ACC97601.1 Dihydrodipicolinate synthase [Elusimicrobium minutum Pei191]